MLWHIHKEIAGPGAGRKHRQDILNRAAIVLISACWESDIEDVAVEASDYLLENARTYDAFPVKIRTLASRELRRADDERRVWDLAGDGWRKVLQDHRESVKDKWLRDFNTPKSQQVRHFYSGLLGLDVTSAWSWKAMSTKQACEKLNEYLTIRGNIAHRVRHDENVPKKQGKEFLAHVANLARKTDEALADHLSNFVPASSW